jgi:GNAT superfamily N-acetyltransferase
MTIEPLPDDLILDLFALYDEKDRPNDMHPPREGALQILAAIRAQGGEVFAALRDEELVGTYSVFICQNLTRGGMPFAIIENVFCKASMRRTGIGRALMEHAKEFARSANCYKVFLQTGARRTENHAFYESCSFQSTKRGYQVHFVA